MALVATLTSPILCAHGGQVSGLPGTGAPRVWIGGTLPLTLTSPLVLQQMCPAQAAAAAIATTGAQHQIVAAFCVGGIIASGSARVSSMGLPLVLTDSVAMGVPSGLPLQILPAQVRVHAK